MTDRDVAARFGFILSTGRTGTKAIAHHLDGCEPGVLARHEPGPSRLLGIASNLAICGRVDRASLSWLLRGSHRAALRERDASLIVESNPFLHGFLEVLDDVFQRARVIHVVRHPDTYITSALDWGSHAGARGLASRFIPYWVLTPDLVEPAPARRRRDMSDAEWLGWRWAAVNRHLNRGVELFGDRYLRVRFEDVFDAERGGMDAINRCLGLAVDASGSARREVVQINASRPRGNPRPAEWTPALRERIRESCGELAALYGYTL
ncbi:MAG: hypothetical protein ACE5FL_03595 [Myxococcota bacterium]